MNALAACTALAVAVAIASAASAGPDRYFGPRGYKPQTWADIERDREEIQRLVQQRQHPGTRDSVAFPDFVAHPSYPPSDRR
ncbi:MAG TPA: hypothetical protein VKW08_13575 [Xanthobacteraceae bacterium]|nr:hypothetical protein [Xanthobacteraceae bacterium]